jgi:hypothetical protein
VNILKYREYIDTECTDHQQMILNKKAIKLDGNSSLKMAVECGDLKSCDYLKYKKEKILLIEISDIKRQLQDLVQKTWCISQESKETLGKKLAKKIEPKKIIKEELRDKYIQTTLILYKLVEQIKFNINKSKAFIVAICSNSNSDVMAFDFIRLQLKQSLKGLIDDVQIVPAKDLGMVV